MQQISLRVTGNLNLTQSISQHIISDHILISDLTLICWHAIMPRRNSHMPDPARSDLTYVVQQVTDCLSGLKASK